MRKLTWEQVSCKHCLAMHNHYGGLKAVGREVPA